MDAKIQTILTHALTLFQEYGIKSISMDDLASSLRMAKKTIYKDFKNKEHIIEELFLDFLSVKFHEHSQTGFSKNLNAIDFLFNIKDYIIAHRAFFTPAINHDLKTIYPHIYTRVQQKVIADAQMQIQKNIELGITQGLYNSHKNHEIFIHLFSQMILLIESRDQDIFAIEDIFDEIIRIFVYAVANEQGISKYESIIASKK